MVELHWTSDGERVVTASPDKSVRAWDVASGQQVKKMAEHDSFVNSCCPLRRGPPLLVSGSDDGTAKVGTSKKEHAAFAAGRAATAIGCQGRGVPTHAIPTEGRTGMPA